jgi:flagellar biosynthesis/type III secretory pathway M-ring protein FliF/YscJ
MFLLKKIDKVELLLENAVYMKKKVSLKKIKRFGKKFFTKTNILIVFLIVVFVFFAIFLFRKTREDRLLESEVVPLTEFDVQVSEIDSFKKEVNYNPPSEEEVLKQIEELEELRKVRMGD